MRLLSQWRGFQNAITFQNSSFGNDGAKRRELSRGGVTAAVAAGEPAAARLLLAVLVVEGALAREQHVRDDAQAPHVARRRVPALPADEHLGP